MKPDFRYRTKIFIMLLLLLFSCQQKKSDEVNDDKRIYTLGDFRKLNSINEVLLEAAPGEWLYSQSESGQSFNAYVNSNPICPNFIQNTIYLYLIGEFDDVDMFVLKKLKEYVGIFFGLNVVMINAVSDSIIPQNARRINMGVEQLDAKYILHNVLKGNSPTDAIVSMAICSKDLYPEDSWNFVFGLASLKGRVGVSSIYRFKSDTLNTTNCHEYMNRVFKTITHEIAHMFSIEHCVEYKCLMNGSISLDEADKKPTWLCGECLAKVIWNSRADVISRYDGLIKFFNENGYPEKVQFYEQAKEILLKK